MKILLDIQDDKASFILEVLKNFKYVKTKPLTNADSKFLSELQESVNEIKLIKAGKLDAKPAEEWLNEL